MCTMEVKPVLFYLNPTVHYELLEKGTAMEEWIAGRSESGYE